MDDPGDGSEANGDASFNAAAWSPEDQAYGLFYLMVIRQTMEPEKLPKPAEIAHLKFVASRDIKVDHPPSERKHRRQQRSAEESRSDDDDSDEISEGEPYEESEQASWPGKRLSWWRVHSLLNEDVVVREGLSIASAELRRLSPGEALQQAGNARCFISGRAKGCIRLPVKPRGWVTADATRAGGPRYLVSTTPPRWRVDYRPRDGDGDATVKVRSDVALDSEEVAVLYYGDIVEQAGPSEIRGQGILRMPVTSAISKRNEADDDSPRGNQATNASKILGWVTLDASSAGGPVFFKPAPDNVKQRRRRRPQQGWT
mmetsp:Transcript_28992/g.46742  ORF Transcript_28992/g.46742 Transcript_28992/m.46742 type:complete len:315 (-) Transcript_28992:96-1040(-)